MTGPGPGVRRDRLFGWLPQGRGGRAFLVVAAVDATGSGLFIASSAFFFTRVLDLSSTEIGVGLSLSGVGGLLALLPLGRLADRTDPRAVLVGLHVWRGLCFALYPLVRSPLQFFVLTFFVGVAEWSVSSMVQAVVGRLEEGDSRLRTMATTGVVRNVGFAVGGLLAAAAAVLDRPAGYTGLVLADAASYFLAAALLARLPVSAVPRSDRGGAGRRRDRLPGARFLLLTGLNGVLYVNTVLLTVGLPLWVISGTDAPRAMAALVIVVNTVVVVTTQVRLSRGADETGRAARCQRRSGAALAVCCLLVAFSSGVGSAGAAVLVLLAAVALSLGEIWQQVGAWGLSYALSPADQQAYYLSVYNVGLSGASIVGPALITATVFRAGGVGWAVLAAAFAATGAAVVLVARGGVSAAGPEAPPSPA